MFYMKIHENQNGRVVAVCDSDLLGKTFEEGGRTLDLKRYAAFYKGERVGKNEVFEGIKSFSSLNLVGAASVGIAIEAGVLSKSHVLEIAGVPQAQVYKI